MTGLIQSSNVKHLNNSKGRFSMEEDNASFHQSFERMSRPSLKNSIRLGDPYPSLPEETDENAEEHSHCLWTAVMLRLLQRFDQSRQIKVLRDAYDDLAQHQRIVHDPAYKAWLDSGIQDSCQDLNTEDLDGSGSPSKLRLCISGAPENVQMSLLLFMLDELQRLKSQTKDKIQVLYFICDPRDRSANSPVAMLKTWLYQMIQQRPDLMQPFCQWVVDPDNLFVYHDKATMLWNELREVAKNSKAGTIYCIVVGLHDWTEKNVENAMRLFETRFPLEGCLENDSKLRILAIDSERIQSKKFGNIDLSAHLEITQQAEKGEMKTTTVDHLLEEASARNGMSYRETLEILGAYRQPPSMELLAWAFDESAQALQQRIELAHSDGAIIEAAGCVNFLTAQACQIFSQTNNRPSVHLRLARKCLDVITKEFAQIDIRMLEQLQEGRFPAVPDNLLYAILFWAEHTQLSLDHSDELLDQIMVTFSRDSLTIAKWWIVYLHEVCHIYKTSGPQGSYTTVLHILAYFGLHGLLQRALDGDRWQKLQEYLDTEDCMNKSPLSLALLQNQNAVARILVTAGAEINFVHISLAATSNLELADLVFNHYKGEPLNHDQMGDILGETVTSGSEKVVARTVQFLKSNGGQNVFPWDDDNSLLHAIELGQEGFIRHLLKIANLESMLEDLIKFTVETHEETILMMLIEMPSIRRIIQAKKLTLLPYLLKALESRCPLMVNTLLTEINIDLKDDEGYSPFQVATRFLNVQTLCQFVHHPSFHFSGRSAEEGVALNLLLHKDRLNIPSPLINLREILERGARMQYEHFGITALHVAAELGRTEVIQVLLGKLSKAEIKADIDRQPSSRHRPQWDDTTALAIAAMKGHTDIVKLLLIHGADQNIKDRNGKIPLQLAQERGHLEIVEVLELVKKEGMTAFSKRERQTASKAMQEETRRNKRRGKAQI